MFEYFVEIENFLQIYRCVKFQTFYFGIKKELTLSLVEHSVQWMFYDVVENVDESVNHIGIYNFRKWYWM